MKITVYYEDNRKRTTIEVPDEDCEIWVETDYQRRLAAAEDKSSVMRRTAQQIMDEECNRPTYNVQHKETRRHVSLEALDPMGDTLIGMEDVELDEDEYAELYKAMQSLAPQQRELLRKVFWEMVKEADIARADGVHRSAVSMRMSRIYDRLRDLLKNTEFCP